MKTKFKGMPLKTFCVYILGILGFFLVVYFAYHDCFLYKKTIAEVITTKVVSREESVDLNHNKDTLFSQKMTARIKNGQYKGRLIHLNNSYSSSGAFEQKYHDGTELFVSVQKDRTGLKGTIGGVKRDKEILIVAGLFIFVLLAIGKKRGLLSIISLAINVVLLSFVLDLYLDHRNASLLLLCMGAVVLFTVVSLLLVGGNKEKTYVAILATLIGTFVSLLIAYAVIQLTDGAGLHYESMEFVTIPHQQIFMAEILVGALGAVMDVAITLTSSMYELYERNKAISLKALTAAGRKIGGDIMGAMTNILLFAYVSGTIPMILLYLKNNSPLIYTFSVNLSLELARALTGSIGIVLTIPITLYLSRLFIYRKGDKR